ncbi:MAG: preprotein translocase subunit SecG [Verrucomicrobia bacterium]|nr:preprotein translocase subunit SecG [Verrucomicrobiota bacterium]
MSFFYFFSIVCFLVTCLLLCLIILLQEGKGGGLGTSFGGGDSSDSLFGTSTPEVLKQITSILAGVFVVFCLILSFWTSSLTRHKTAEYVPQELIQAQTEIEQ